MTLIPWEYIKKYLVLSKITPFQAEKKLNYYGLETKIVEQENNLYLEVSVPSNRSDLLTWWGIIREMGTLLNCRNKLPCWLSEENKERWCKLAITETNECYEFHAILLKNIEIKESLPWIKDWLKVNGLRSVNNITDIANLVMLETGQPFQVFDYNNLPKKEKTNQILVRRADKGEKFVSLQGQNLILDPQDLVVVAGGKIIELAGVIGSKKTALNPQTKNVLVECASYNPAAIQKTTQRLNISTPTSQNFIRGTHLIVSPLEVLKYAISLISKLYGGEPTTGIISNYRKRKKNPPLISISSNFITKKIGHSLTFLVIENIWKQLNFRYQKKGEIYYITPPFYRPDITQAEDLLEEILKVYDYNKIKSSLPTFKHFISVVDKDDKEKEKKRKELRIYLTNCGWQEIITYSLISPAMKKHEKKNPYQLLVPKSENHKYYRSSLVSSHLETIKYNLSHGKKDLLFFEISSVYASSQPEEILILSGIGKTINQPFFQLNYEADFYWMKGVLENIFFRWGISENITFLASSSPFFSSFTEIFCGKKRIGFLGCVNQKEQILMAQISLTEIFSFLIKNPRQKKYQPISNFPTSEKDLSFLFPDSVDYYKVINEIKKIGGENLREVKIFDIYQNAELEKKAQKSVSFHLVFQSSTKTLENKEIEKIINNIGKKIEKIFTAKLRG